MGIVLKDGVLWKRTIDVDGILWHESLSPGECAEAYAEAADEIAQLRDDLDLRNQTAIDRKEIIARLEADNERLRGGVREIQEFLNEDRTGDASFVCEALLAE